MSIEIAIKKAVGELGGMNKVQLESDNMAVKRIRRVYSRAWPSYYPYDSHLNHHFWNSRFYGYPLLLQIVSKFLVIVNMLDLDLLTESAL